jgi:4-amino-4-deoxy-L-arabinose transferase-like glycosyltransferase
MTFLKPFFPIFIVFLTLTCLGIFFSILLPLYQGPDEQVHYATIQYRAEPKEKTWPIENITNHHADGNDISTFHFSEEVIQLGKLSNFDDIKWQGANTSHFTTGTLGPLEADLRTNTYKHLIDVYPQNTSSNASFYYWISSSLEQFFYTSNVIERFFVLRLFSFFLYLGTLFIIYRIAKKVFDTYLHQILFTLLVGLQPMLLATGTIVNIDIALIFGTTLFFWSTLRLIEKPSPSNHLLTLISLAIAFLGKAPGIAFVPVVIAIYLYLLQGKYQFSFKKIVYFGFYFGALLLILFLSLAPDTLLTTFLNLGGNSKFASPLQSILTYLDKTLGVDALLRTHASYWGNFGWLDTKINDAFLTFLWILEVLAWFGAILFLLSKKTLLYLPNKSVVILSISLLLFLQLAIRFYDWRIFDTVGKIVIGAPGRYFLPTIVPYFLLLVTGFGFLFTKNKSQFTLLLKTLSLGMLLLSMYAVFNVIIPRYYL